MELVNAIIVGYAEMSGDPQTEMYGIIWGMQNGVKDKICLQLHKTTVYGLWVEVKIQVVNRTIPGNQAMVD